MAAVLLATTLVGGTAGPAAAMGRAGASSASLDGTAPFAIPDAALTRPFGQIARVPCNRTFYSGACLGNATGAKQKQVLPQPPIGGLGIPLGGLGAGSFMINQTGSFGPWNFGGGLDPVWEMRTLSQAAFHVREQYGAAPANWRTLTTPGPQEKAPTGLPIPQRSWGSVLPSWRQLSPGEGSYSTLFPFGWMTYKRAFQADVSQRFFSPIVAKEDRRTSLPVAYFDFRVANPTAKRGSYTVMFTMPNAPAHVPNSWGQDNLFDHPVGPASVRQGFTSSVHADRKSGVVGVTMGAQSAKNTPDTQQSEWTVAALPAAGQKASWVSSWNGGGNGSDIYTPFTRDGALPDKALDRSHSAGAVAVKVDLKPGASTVVHFALTWDFPQVLYVQEAQNNAQTLWMRRYTNFYGGKRGKNNDYVAGSYPFHRSFAIADDALAGHDDAVRAVEAWWKPIATDPAYPRALRNAALNELYQWVMHGSFWEGGLVRNAAKPTGSKRIGTLFPDQHLFFNLTDGAGGGPDFESDVDQPGYDAYQLLFPQIDRDIDRARLEQVKEDPNGDPFKDIVSITDHDPFITWSMGGRTIPVVAERGYQDSLAYSIIRSYSYYRRTGDSAFLRWAYPYMSKQLKALQRNDVKPGDHLPYSTPIFHDTYDSIIAGGHTTFMGGLYLLSLEVMQDAGRRLGRPATETQAYATEFAAGKAQFEQTFWLPTPGYYRFVDGTSPNNLSLFLSSFYGQHLAEKLGLPDLVDTGHYRQHLKYAYDKFMGRRDSAGRLLGAPMIAYLGQHVGVPPVPDAVNPIYNGACSTSEACPTVPVLGSDAVWPGANHTTGATYIATGKRFHDPELVRMGTEMSSAVAVQNWSVDTNGFEFASPGYWSAEETTNAHFIAYKWALGVWDALNAIKPIHVPTPTNATTASSSKARNAGMRAQPGATAEPSTGAAGGLPSTGAQTAPALLALMVMVAAAALRRLRLRAGRALA